MKEVHYGVIRQNGVWTILGNGLRFGAYETQKGAEEIARRLAGVSSGLLPVRLHLQDETGELRSPMELR